MTKWLLATALLLMAFPSSGMAQSKASLVGTWKLVSATETTDKGEVKDPFGQNPTGFLTYTADGRVMTIITFGGRKPLSPFPDPPTEEKAEAFTTLVAYAGSYTFSGDTVIHHIEACSIQNLVNTDMVRSVKLQGDRLTLWKKLLFADRGGPMANQELVWERMKPKTTDK